MTENGDHANAQERNGGQGEELNGEQGRNHSLEQVNHSYHDAKTEAKCSTRIGSPPKISAAPPLA